MRGERLVGRVILWTLVAAIGLPPAPAVASGPAGRWSRVTGLKPDTQVVVTYVGPPDPADGRQGQERTAEGWFVSAGPVGMVIHVIGGDVAIPRVRVTGVAVVKEGRPWYVIPAVVAAVIGGAAVSIGVLWLAASSGTAVWPSGDDSPYGVLTIFALPVLAGLWAHRKLNDGRRSLKVIYSAPPPPLPAGDGGPAGPPAW